MIVEFPDPACVGAVPALKKMIRDALLACRGLMPSSDKPFHLFAGPREGDDQRRRVLRPAARARGGTLGD